MLYSRIKRFKVPKNMRRPLGIVLAELTKEPQKRNKTDVYYRGVSDGVELVRKRARDMGLSLEEPYTEVRSTMALIELQSKSGEVK